MGDNNNSRYLVAFEIGSSKIRGAIGSVDHSGIVEVIAVEEEKLVDKVRYGCIQNVEVGNALLLVAERLQHYPRIDPRRITGAYVALGGRSTRSDSIDVQLHLPAETEITTPIINDLVQQAAATVGSDRDVVDVVPVRFTVDNKKHLNPVGAYGQDIAATMTVLSCAPQMKRMLRRVITERLGLKINGYIPRALAEADMVLTDDERRLGSMFVDFGAETTTVAFYKNGACIYVATLPIGSRNITLDLTTLNYIEERAEEIKKISGNAMAQDNTRRKELSDGVDYTDVNNYVHARADEIVANIMAQIDYAGLTDADIPGGIVIVGGGARLRGFNELLADQSKLKVRQGAPSSAVRITDGSISRTENVDVIAVLLAASQQNEAECLSPAPETREPKSGSGSYGDIYSDDETEGGSRIGRLDEDEPDTDADEEPARNTKSKPTEENSHSHSSLGSLLTTFRERLTRMIDDQTDFQD